MKNKCKISIFSFGHSDRQWVGAVKMMKKPLLHPDASYGKKQICIGNSKNENLRTYGTPKIDYLVPYVLQHAKKCCGGEICFFPHQKCFFARFFKSPVLRDESQCRHTKIFYILPQNNLTSCDCPPRVAPGSNPYFFFLKCPEMP